MTNTDPAAPTPAASRDLGDPHGGVIVLDDADLARCAVFGRAARDVLNAYERDDEPPWFKDADDAFHARRIAPSQSRVRLCAALATLVATVALGWIGATAAPRFALAAAGLGAAWLYIGRRMIESLLTIQAVEFDRRLRERYAQLCRIELGTEPADAPPPPPSDAAPDLPFALYSLPARSIHANGWNFDWPPEHPEFAAALAARAQATGLAPEWVPCHWVVDARMRYIGCCGPSENTSAAAPWPSGRRGGVVGASRP